MVDSAIKAWLIAKLVTTLSQRHFSDLNIVIIPCCNYGLPRIGIHVQNNWTMEILGRHFMHGGKAGRCKNNHHASNFVKNSPAILPLFSPKLAPP